MRTLRSRLILSHILPLLVIIPLVGLILIYVLQTQAMLENLSRELTGQAVLVAQIASDHPDIWYDSSQAQLFVARLNELLEARAMLFTPGGALLASSDPADADRLGRRMELAGLDEALSGNISVRVDAGQSAGTQQADVLVPVLGLGDRVIGVVRLTHPLTDVYARFYSLRTLSVGVIAIGLLLGIAGGWLLALELERPLRRATEAIHSLAVGRDLVPLPEQGPEEVRLLQQAFNALAERLRTLEDNRRRLLANLVHELGRPLGALLSATQALQAGAGEDAALRQDLLGGMEGEIGRLQRLLDDLARLHDQAVGGLELNRRPVDLNAWLPQAAGVWREAAQEKGVHWESDLAADLPALNIDPDRLGQALGNLLNNAIQYTPAGGTVRIQARVEMGRVCIGVRDSGPGITAGEQARIFQPFYRGQTGRRFPQGMGLGLTIARDLVAAHGGRLTVASVPGQGSEFVIELPEPLPPAVPDPPPAV